MSHTVPYQAVALSDHRRLPHDPHRATFPCAELATARIRPLGEADAAALVGLLARCSPATLRRRFHGNVGWSRANLFAPLRPDHARAGFVAESEDQIVGVATALSATDDLFEVAVLVEDSWQGCHLGSALVSELVSWCGDRGHPHVAADTDRTNVAAVRLIEATARRFGLRVTVAHAAGPEVRYLVHVPGDRC